MTSTFPSALTALPQTSTARHVCFTSSSRRRICTAFETEIARRDCTTQHNAALLSVLLERALYIQNFSASLLYFEAVTKCLYRLITGAYDESIRTKSAAAVANEVVTAVTCNPSTKPKHQVQGQDQDQAQDQDLKLKPKLKEPKADSYYTELLKSGPDLCKNMTSDASATTAFTVAITCRKCKSSKITFNQKQTRSADEAMTVFCQCSDCSYRWKM